MKTKYIVGLVISIIIFIGVLVASRIVKSKYNAQREAFETELAGIPVFDVAAETELLKKKLNLNDKALTQKYKTESEILAGIEKPASIQTEKKFSSNVYKKEFLDRQNKLMFAKRGDIIKFQAKNKFGNIITVKGKYEGIVGKDIFVNGKNIPKKKVLKQYRHLFSKNLSIRRRADLSRTFKDDFNKRKKEYYKQLKSDLENDALKQAGYLKINGSWITPPELLAQFLEQRKKDIDAERENYKKQLAGKYKVFGIEVFDVEAPTKEDK